MVSDTPLFYIFFIFLTHHQQASDIHTVKCDGIFHQ